MNRLAQLIRVAVHKYSGNRNTGVLLSGGIDSSTIAAFAPRLPSFTGYYEGDAYDERKWARMLKSENHHEIEITAGGFVEHFDEMMEAVEAPFAGPGTFGQFMVAKYVAAQGVELVLSGEGGDELFGGYARLHLVAGVPPPEGYEDYKLPVDYPSTLKEALAWEWEVNLPALLRVDEQVTRANGIEAVAPMLEPEVVEYALAQPPSLRVGKRLLKDAMRHLVPDEILERKDKRGFPVPFVEWAQEEPVRSFVLERIGYVPDAALPWDRKWWLDLCEASSRVPA